MIKKYLCRFVLLSLSLFFLGWGSIGHQIINRNSTLSFPNELNFLLYWTDLLSAHGSDADYRKGSDPNEGPKHYIDIDNYPEFVSSGRINHIFDSLVIQHGSSFVIDQGILPWTIMQTVDSLQAAFQRGDWQRALLVASDLGHYIGDAHMPLHITRNYNGQYTGQPGIHFRYESDMINSYQRQISYSGDTVSFVSNVSEFVFELLYANYDYVDSVLQGDLAAKSFAGGVDNSAYYQKLWELTKNFTLKLYKNASYDIACLIYTAWKNAGKPMVTSIDVEDASVNGFRLEQNYPNPFNPSTKISWQSTIGSWQTLKIFDALGNEVVTLVDEYKQAGNYEVEFTDAKTRHARSLPSGVYFYKLKVGDFAQTKKMILLH